MKTQIYPINEMTAPQVAQVVRAVQGGALVALATDTVYGLAAGAFDETAIGRIYELKGRPANMPLQILVNSIEQAQQVVQWNERAEKLARAYWPGGLTLILPPNERGQSLRRGFEGLGLRVPNHRGLLNLLTALPWPLVCTSANVHGQPVITTEKALYAFCNKKVEFILTDGTLSPVASSVIDLMGASVLLREGAVSRNALESTLNEPLK